MDTLLFVKVRSSTFTPVEAPSEGVMLGVNPVGFVKSKVAV